AVFGTNSEANSLSTEEKSELLAGLVAAGVNPGSMMPGTGSCSLTDAVRLTSTAVNLGCRGVLMLPPFYYKNVSDEGLYRFYAEVIQRVGDQRLQIYLYHIPPVSNVPLSLSLVQRLVRDFPETIAGIKDSSGNWQNTLALLQAGLDDFRVFCGSESFLLQTMRHGGAGCISATVNVNPTGIRRLYEHYTDPDADQRQADLDQLRGIYQNLPMIPALKSTLARFNKDPEWHRLRPPLLALDAQQREQLGNQLASLGFTL
ncbi:MAG: dihydrodipicolinate synthase family protein, partial [Pseudohongiellaceae bacterium]